MLGDPLDASWAIRDECAPGKQLHTRHRLPRSFTVRAHLQLEHQDPLKFEYATFCSARLACDGRYDTRLTDEGQAQATLAGVDAKALSPIPEVLIASPLSRALHTAELAFGNKLCPTIVEPLCSERIWLSSDVGRQPAELQQDFPTVDLDNLEDVWWHNNGSGNLQHVLAETPGKITFTCLLTAYHNCMVDQTASVMHASLQSNLPILHLACCSFREHSCLTMQRSSGSAWRNSEYT